MVNLIDQWMTRSKTRMNYTFPYRACRWKWSFSPFTCDRSGIFSEMYDFHRKIRTVIAKNVNFLWRTKSLLEQRCHALDFRNFSNCFLVARAGRTFADESAKNKLILNRTKSVMKMTQFASLKLKSKKEQQQKKNRMKLYTGKNSKRL